MSTKLNLIAESGFDRQGLKKAGQSDRQADICSVFSDALPFLLLLSSAEDLYY